MANPGDCCALAPICYGFPTRPAHEPGCRIPSATLPVDRRLPDHSARSGLRTKTVPGGLRAGLSGEADREGQAGSMVPIAKRFRDPKTEDLP